MTNSTERRPLGGGAPSTSGLRWAFVIGLGLCVALFLVGGNMMWAVRERTVAFAVLFMLSVLAQARRVAGISGPISQSVLSILLVAAGALVGPAAAALIGIVAALLSRQGSSRQLRIFNVGMIGALGGVSGTTYILCGGLTDFAEHHGPTELLLRVALPVICADLAMALANATMIGVMLGLHRGLSPIPFTASLLRSGGTDYLGYGIIGVMLVILWEPVGLGAGSVVLVLGPILIAQWASQQVADEIASHERTVAALVAAGEGENVFTEGHSRRVAKIAGLIASTAGRDDSARETLRLAALLHDIGTMAIPSRGRTRGSGLTQEEIQQYRQHPEWGCQVIAGIEFLEPVLASIRHHHERYDGTGFPDGLSGARIPWNARVIAVADAFDSLTSSRPDRPALTTEEALARLWDLAGTQLDPELVTSLAIALERATWEPNLIDDETIADAGRAWDHDDPDQGLLLVRSQTTEEAR